MTRDGLQIDETSTEGGVALALSGAVTVRHVARLSARLGQIDSDQDVDMDLSRVDRIDTAGAWALSEFERRRAGTGAALRLAHASPATAQVIDTVRQALPDPQDTEPTRYTLRSFLEATGRGVAGAGAVARYLTGFLGLFLARMGRILRHPSELPVTALFAHAEDVGLRAVPIVALMAFLIGVVLAFQGASQLQQFGAEVFVVDLIAISILRELGILLTAIIVAGRTASAFTAAIGSMKMREEIDAMRTLGIDPAMVLFVPRILALLLMLPILGLIANVMGLLGGALMAWVELGISPSMFLIRLIEGTDVSHVIVGLVKAPFFALIIGVVGCHAGMQVKGNAESLGRMTSKAVVTAIFAVILADALFSVFFAQVGL